MEAPSLRYGQYYSSLSFEAVEAASGREVLDAPHQFRQPSAEGRQGDGQHGGETEACVDGCLLQTSHLEAAEE